jgi:hypothetical protein
MFHFKPKPAIAKSHASSVDLHAESEQFDDSNDHFHAWHVQDYSGIWTEMELLN